MTPSEERGVEGSRIWQRLPEETRQDVYALVQTALSEAHGAKEAAEDWIIQFLMDHPDQALFEDIARAVCLAVIEEVWTESTRARGREEGSC